MGDRSREPSLLALQDADAGYGDQPAIRGVTLRIDRGDRIVVLGASGAGKSTLCTLVYDRLRASGATVALIPQSAGLVPSLSAFHNVYMGRLDRYGAALNLLNLLWPLPQRRREVAALLDRLDVREEIHRPVGELSGGQQQRVAVARALYSGARILVADEPTASLDQNSAHRTLAALAADFDTCVVAMHDTELALAFATRVVGLRRGRTVFDDAPGAVSQAILDSLYAD